ncbi:hypothetical protein PBT90_18110 [Algoriphagus halophytocola]|uniref:Kazal-like domain-containing protein n=1 Tax=Algoriphagus halophytocola TaxID=2991499 RepID=A0ABY6MCK6_9BACT|nr:MULTISPECIES: hypothetical protein [unclassified Algoriphagus]UZD21432.1 hypothetical protein OM944_12240 [Algoriphagus sp. TR-M5]WBL42644.1 hypothetical protein PBT90_18110 [Algoriphagus sp. TR-M9]
MKNLKILFALTTLFALPTFGMACSGTWYTCENLEEFLIEVAENCPCDGGMIIQDCDAGMIELDYSCVD